jgi:hypothetical protein
VWGIFGITLIIGSAIYRVLPHAIDAFKVNLTYLEWTVLILWCLFMVVAEGYRGFQKFFSPLVAARTWYLVDHSSPIDLIFAPLFCIGYFHATKKRIITSWLLTSGITLLVVAVSNMSQPWRGIVDSGVLLGLLYGLIWVYIFMFKTFKKRSYIIDPELVSNAQVI